MAIEIVDLPIKCSDFPYFLCLPFRQARAIQGRRTLQVEESATFGLRGLGRHGITATYHNNGVLYLPLPT